MKINPVLNNFNFGKTYLGKVQVKNTDDEPEYVNFVEFDPDDKNDGKELRKIKRKWGKKAIYIGSIIDSFNYAKSRPQITLSDGCIIQKGVKSMDYRFFGLENEQGDILTLAQTSEEYGSDELEIDTIQASPKELYGARTRKYKRLGAALVAKIIEIAKNNGRQNIITTSDNDGFWHNSGLFKPEEAFEGFIYLEKEDFDKYINYAGI